jgi:hypothetical protein
MKKHRIENAVLLTTSSAIDYYFGNLFITTPIQGHIAYAPDRAYGGAPLASHRLLWLKGGAFSTGETDVAGAAEHFGLNQCPHPIVTLHFHQKGGYT